MAVGVSGPSAAAAAGHAAVQQSIVMMIASSREEVRDRYLLRAPRLHSVSVRRCSPARSAIVVAAVTASILTSLTLFAPSAAFADGDPASDVLVNAPLFNPIDSGVPYADSARLTALLAASVKAGFPIRVALIASQTDLGTVTALWKQPAKY